MVKNNDAATEAANPNMAYWQKMARPPASTLKTIKGGRLNGMTDIKPQWRYQVMTETFGPIGIGWRFDIVKAWTSDGPDGQVAQFAEVHLYVRHNGEWSDAIPGIGGSMLVAKERSGPHMSDEAVKMAVTDALGSCMKMLGVAADIYMGQWDGSKYRDEENGHNGEPAASRRETPNGSKVSPTKRAFVDAVQDWAQVGKEDIGKACIDILKACGAYETGKPATDGQMKIGLQWIEANKQTDFAEKMAECNSEPITRN